MIGVELLRQTRQLVARSRLAAQRSVLAQQCLAHCQLCAHHCGANRLAGERGPCRAGATARLFSSQIETADELLLVPTYAIALSGCDFRCDFCITGALSWNPSVGQPFNPQATAERAARALERGARTIMILGGEPTIHLPAVLEFVAALPDEAPLVWKTNAHGSIKARELLEGMFDVWVADYKFGNDNCAQRLARISNYSQIVQENLTWANTQTDLIVRHLLMPGHLECCWRPIAGWLQRELPGVKVSLRDGFWPGWHSARHPELTQTTSATETHRARQIAREFELCLIE